MTSADDTETKGKITPEGDKAMRNRIGVLLPSRDRGPVAIPANDTKPTSLKTDCAVDVPGCVW